MKTSFSLPLAYLLPSTSALSKPAYYSADFRCGRYSFQLYIFPSGNAGCASPAGGTRTHLSAYLSLRQWFAARPAAPAAANAGASAATSSSAAGAASAGAQAARAAASPAAAAGAPAAAAQTGPHVEFSLKVTSTNGHELANKSTEHTFTKGEDDWGYTCLCPLADINARLSEGEPRLSVDIYALKPGPETPLDLSAAAAVASKGMPAAFQEFFGDERFADCIVRTEPDGAGAQAASAAQAAKVSASAAARTSASGEGTAIAATGMGCAFSCHRVVLAAASPVFAACFSSGLLEAQQREITIRDADPAAVQLLLQNMYGQQQLDVPLPLLLPLMALADRYGLQGLWHELQEWLGSRAFSCEALSVMLPQARALGCDEACKVLAAGVLEHVGEFVAAGQQLMGCWQLEDVAVLLQHAREVKQPLAAFKLAVAWTDTMQQQLEHSTEHSTGACYSDNHAINQPSGSSSNSSSSNGGGSSGSGGSSRKPEAPMPGSSQMACRIWAYELLPLIDLYSLDGAERIEACALVGASSIEGLRSRLLQGSEQPAAGPCLARAISAMCADEAACAPCCSGLWSFSKRSRTAPP